MTSVPKVANMKKIGEKNLQVSICGFFGGDPQIHIVGYYVL